MTRQNVAGRKLAEKLGGRRKRGHRFFLNPYEDAAFTRCPKCDRKTKIRKFPLVIHIEPAQLFILNKQCRYCPDCDLIIARRSELEKLMAGTFENRNPDIIGNEYLVMGTVTRPTWRTQRAAAAHSADLLDQTLVFRDVWNFKLAGGWPMSCGRGEGDDLRSGPCWRTFEDTTGPGTPISGRSRAGGV